MKKISFVVAAVMISSQLIAQDSTARLLDEAVVTATKTEQKQNVTGKVVTVISKEMLEKSTGKTVAQVLNEQAGITIAGAYNALGSVQTVFMRGASSGRVLILMDGVPVNDPSMINNEFDLNLFSINDIERIEVCRGAQSTLYGSDAIAGVINIITVKKDIDRSFNIKATTGFGNKNTVRNNVQLYGRADKLTYTTRFAKLSTDGFSSANDNVGNRNFDKDGYDGNVINAALQYQFTTAFSARAFIQHSQYKADIDAGVFADERDYTIRNSNLSSGAGVNFKKGIVHITGNYQYGELSRKYLNDSLHRPGSTRFESNRYGGRTQYMELYASIKAAYWLTVLAGSDYRWSNMNQQYLSISSFGPYSSQFDDTSMHQVSYYTSSTLPLSWKYFKADRQQEDVLLQWETFNETNTDYFLVQHSNNGVDFTTVGTVTAWGNSGDNRYAFVHVKPVAGIHFYRLEQVDIDGKSKYSSIVKLTIDKSETLLNILSNPVRGKQLQFYLAATEDVTLLSPDGKLLWKKKLAMGNHSINTALYTPGIYLLQAGPVLTKIMIE